MAYSARLRKAVGAVRANAERRGTMRCRLRIRAAWGPCRCLRCTARARGLFRRARFDGTGRGEPYRMHVHGRALRCRGLWITACRRVPNRSPARPRIVAVRWDWALIIAHQPCRHAVGLEAAARQARYNELCTAARESGAIAVLLAHTMDDQAETVLIGLLRSRGVDALAGMPQVFTRSGATLRGHCLPLLSRDHRHL